MYWQQVSGYSKRKKLKEAEIELEKHKEFLALHECIAELPVKYQEVIILRFFEKKQLKEKKVQAKPFIAEEKVFVKKSVSQKVASVPQQPSVPTEKEPFEGYIQEDHADSDLYPAPERRLQTKEDLLPEKEEPINVKGPYEKPFEKDIELDTTKQEKYTEKKEQEIPSPFEKALSSAVEKRQFGANKVEEPPKQPPLKKKLSIRCPECKNIFTVETEEGEFETKIECPKCGRKGIVKQ